MKVCWKYLPDAKDKLEPLEKNYQVVPEFLKRLLARKNSAVRLIAKVHQILHL